MFKNKIFKYTLGKQSVCSSRALHEIQKLAYIIGQIRKEVNRFEVDTDVLLMFDCPFC